MSGNKSYDKGYRFECKIRKELEPFGKVRRSHASGAYSGEPDLEWLWDLRYWTIDCKAGDGWEGKRHRARLEKADICLDGPDRKIPLVILTLPKLLELMGCKAGDTKD
jgi:hypothetical protein